MTKKIIVATSIIGILVVIGSVVAALVLSSANANGAPGNAANGANSSGAIVSITRDAPPYLNSVSAPSSARADAAAAEAGHDALVALYPKWKAALDQQLAAELATVLNGA